MIFRFSKTSRSSGSSDSSKFQIFLSIWDFLNLSVLIGFLEILGLSCFLGFMGLLTIQGIVCLLGLEGFISFFGPSESVECFRFSLCSS